MPRVYTSKVGRARLSDFSEGFCSRLPQGKNTPELPFENRVGIKGPQAQPLNPR